MRKNTHYTRTEREMIGANLLRLRKSKGIELGWVAYQFGCKPKVIWQYERGMGLNDSTIAKLGDILGVSVEEIMNIQSQIIDKFGGMSLFHQWWISTKP